MILGIGFGFLVEVVGYLVKKRFCRGGKKVDFVYLVLGFCLKIYCVLRGEEWMGYIEKVEGRD